MGVRVDGVEAEPSTWSGHGGAGLREAATRLGRSCTGRTEKATGPSVEHLASLVDWMEQSSPSNDDADAIDRLVALDRLAAAVAAATHVEVARFAELAVDRQRSAGVPVRRLGEGVAEQIGLARRASPVTAARQVNLARTLTSELTCVFRLLSSGRVSDWVATIVVGETRELSSETRAALDQELAAALPELSPREAEASARRIAYRLEPEAVMRRSRTARSDRRVSIRPAPDTMSLLSGLLPVEQGVAAWASLDRDAKTLKAQGDERSLSQLRADLMVQRLTGAASATRLPVHVSLVMTADSLLADGDTPARIVDAGPVPTALARRLATNPDAHVFVRRLFTDPRSHTVMGLDPRARLFTGALKRLIQARDQVCRTPYCTAPVRHLDHIRPHSDGGSTSTVNGQGLCERHSYTKDLQGWRTEVIDTLPHTTRITTPTGHRYQSRAPSALGP